MSWTTIALSLSLGFSPAANEVPDQAPAPRHRFSAGTTWLTFANFGPEATNVHMYEFHLGYRLTPRDRLGLKAATWKLFAPMGIPFWDPGFMDEGGFYPGRLGETGLGMTYQRLLWKGLFGQIEILPLWKRYLDENDAKLADGFKLYASYHLGYHIPLWKHRFYLEPQVHCNHWPIDTEGPQGFEEKDGGWSNYFLFEPNLFLGIHF
jgi:hypothetical protein